MIFFYDQKFGFRRVNPIRKALPGILLVPAPTRWMSILTMVKSFGAGHRQLIEDTVQKNAPRHSEKLAYIYYHGEVLNAYIRICSALEKPLKVMELS